MYHRSFRFVAIVPVLCLAVADLCAQSVPDGTFPLPETYFPALKGLIDTAAKQSTRMMARNTEQAVAEANRIAARSGQLPSVGGFLSYYPWVTETRAVAGTTDGQPNPDQVLHPKKLAYNFSINQPIFHWGALRANTRIGELQSRITQNQSAEAYRVLVDEIRAQYLQVIVNKAALARARFNQQVSDEQLTLARDKREKNVISEADMFSPTITAEQARLSSDRALDTYETSLVYLSKLSGSPPLTDDQIPTAIPPITPASSAIQSVTAEFTGKSEVDTFALEALRDQIENERLNYKIADTRLRPKINFTAGTSQDEFSYSVNPADKYKVQSYFAGVSLNWTIFDGFATRSAKRISLARRRQLEENYRNQTEDVIATVKTQMRQLDYAARNLAIVEKMLGSARNVLTARKEDIGRGIASDTDVNAAQLSFYDWELAAYGARNDYLLRVARLLSATQKDPALINVPIQTR
jgi:outer membrane protein TolC